MVKLGLGDSYENVSILTPKARGYLDLTKPASSLGVAFSFFFASLFYFLYTNQAGLILNNVDTIIYASATVALSHGASQALNMAEDAEMDAETEHKKNRPIPAGIVTTEEARTLAWFLILGALTRAYLTSIYFGVIITLSVFFGVFYNLKPIRAKGRVISIPWQATSRGLLMFPAVWAAYGNPFNSIVPWVLSIFMFWYVFGFQNSADILDKEIDSEYGVKTFVVIFGVDKIPYIAAGAMLMMFSTIILGIELGWIEQRFIWMLGILPFCLLMVYHLTFNPHDVNEKTGNHPSWLWFYVGMVLTVLIPLLTELYY